MSVSNIVPIAPKNPVIIHRKTLPAKPLVNGTKFMVSTPHILASQAAEKILKQNGNAIDAAIAAHLVLSLVTPEATGIGGGGFINVYDKKLKKPIIYDARETAPANIKPDAFLDQNGNLPSSYLNSVSGGRTVGVPGIVKGLWEMHKNHGKLPWDQLFAPAIYLAENGFAMPKRLHNTLKKMTHYTRLSPAAQRYYRPDGSVKAVGETIKNPELANTYKQLAQNGIDSFYTGKIAQDIVRTATQTKIFPSNIHLDDLKDYKVIQRQPAQIDYKDFTIYVPPAPSSGGIAVLQSLKLLEPFKLESFDANDLNTETVINNAIRMAYKDRGDNIGDPDFVKMDQDKLLSTEYLKPKQEILANQDSSINVQNDPQKNQDVSTNTSHSSFIDQEGNGVSITSSVEFAFGSGLETEAGFLLNSTLCDFNLDSTKTNAANKIAPKKRPASAMCPTIVTHKKDGDLRLLIGSPGGPAIIGFLVRKIIDILDHGIPAHKAISRPNILPIKDDNTIELEGGLSTDIEKDFFKKHHFDPVPVNLWLSGFQTVEKNNGYLSGASDPRRDGAAIGG